MDRKKLLLILGIVTLLMFCLCGCGKNKITGSETYSANEVKELQISADAWKINIMASSDDNIRISLDGSVSDKDDKPTVSLQHGIVTIVQKSSDEELQDQIALGKKGEIMLYLPSDCIIPVRINNEIGDIDIDSISATEFQLANNAGYVTFSHFAADSLKISSSSGDITVKDSEVSSAEIVTTSGYVQLNNTIFSGTEIITKSGEVNMSEISPQTNISIQTGSGDINLNYQTSPDNLSFSITSGSKDISASFNGAAYSKETSSCRQGTLGAGDNNLEIGSDNGTVVVK